MWDAPSPCPPSGDGRDGLRCCAVLQASDTFEADLAVAIKATAATIAFDATVR